MKIHIMIFDYEIINQFCKVIEENIKSYKEQNEIDN